MINSKTFAFVISSALCLLATFATSTEVYTWRDEAGLLVFSDSPKQGAEPLEITINNNIVSPIDTSIFNITPKAIAKQYKIEVIEPKNDATIRDNNGSVYITGRIFPVLQQDLRIQLYLDGILQPPPQKHASFSLKNIARGEHKIKIDIINDKGKVIASTEEITFYMHRAMVNKAR